MPFELTDLIRRRIEDDRVVWLVTVSPAGQPSTRPVWFVWDGDEFVVYTRPDDAKSRHIAGNDRVALNFNSDALGRDVVVIFGRAVLVPDPVPPSAFPGYLDKYVDRFPIIGYDVESYDATFRAALRIRPERSWQFPP